MSATETTSPQIFRFTKDGKFLSNKAAVTLTLDATASPAVAAAIAADQPFPAGTLRLGTVLVKAGTEDIEFGSSGKGTVSFSGSGAARTGLGVYSDAADLIADIGGDTKLLEGISLNSSGVRRFVASYWGYNLAAAGKGSVALGTGGSIKFGASGSKEGLHAVIRAYGSEPNARTAIGEVIDAWRLPRQVTDGPPLEPGTFIIAEVDGEFAASIGAQYGFNFNWIRKVGLQNLAGDVGLKIQSAVEVSLGFSASGKYALIVSRESLNPSENTVRVRLHKMSAKGLSFAANGSLGIKGKTGKLLPQELDQLITGLFGTAAPQIVGDLKIVRTLADPSVPLNKLAGDFLNDFAKKKLSHITDARQRFGEAQKRIVSFLDLWDHLGPKASAVLWNAANRKDNTFNQAIDALAANTADIKAIIASEFSKIDFFQTSFGQFVEAQAETSVLAMLGSLPEMEKLREAAQQVQSVVSGEVLSELTTWVDEKLGVDKIRNATFDSLDQRLKEKLSDFLGKPLDDPGLKNIRSAINELVKKADTLYAEALKALNTQYNFEFSAKFQKTTTKEALLDVSFDFSNNPNLTKELAAAIDGDFAGVLASGAAGIKLNAAQMTHGIKRQTHVDFSMPYFSGSTDRLNEAIAKLEVRAEGGGLFMFDLKAQDEETKKRNNRTRWSSSLAVSMKLTALAGTGVRSYGNTETLGQSMSVTYGFKRAVPNMTTAALVKQLRPLQQTYFPHEFGVPGKPALDDWAVDLDKVFDQIENNGTGNLGNAILSLQVSAPGTVLAGWLEAPSKEKDAAYLTMSRSIQTNLKQLIPYCYFQDPNRYKGANSAAAAVLIYSAMPPLNSMHLDGARAIPDSNPSPHWDVFDQNLVRAVVMDQTTLQHLSDSVAEVQRLLSRLEGLQKHAGFYARDQISSILRSGATGTGLHLLVNALLFTEAEVIKSAIQAGKSMAQFRNNPANRPAEALEELADFGHHLTAAFNSKLTDLFDAPDEPDLLRNFGLQVFIGASRALQAVQAETTSALDIAILRTKTKAGAVVFPPANFPQNEPLTEDQIGVHQRIVAI